MSDAVVEHADTLRLRGRLSAGGRTIPLELDAQIHRLDGELEIEAAATAPHRELGMTYTPLRMIAARSRLSVKARLTPLTRRSSQVRADNGRAFETTANPAGRAVLGRRIDRGGDGG